MTGAIGDHTWELDQVHSHVGFAVMHMGVSSFTGSFSGVEASLVERDGKLSLAGSVHPREIVVKHEKLHGHLLGTDFFDADDYPDITFASTSVSVEDGVIDAAGDLTMKGVTGPVTVRGRISEPTEDLAGRTKLGLSLAAEIDRTAFGVDWNAPLPGGGMVLADQVSVTAELQFVAS